jgi:hypothetical protein
MASIPGSTVFGSLNAAYGTFTQRISAASYYGDGSHLTGIVTTQSLPLTGATLTGSMVGTNASFSNNVSANAFYGDGTHITNISTRFYITSTNYLTGGEGSSANPAYLPVSAVNKITIVPDYCLDNPQRVVLAPLSEFTAADQLLIMQGGVNKLYITPSNGEEIISVNDKVLTAGKNSIAVAIKKSDTSWILTGDIM